MTQQSGRNCSCGMRSWRCTASWWTGVFLNIGPYSSLHILGFWICAGPAAMMAANHPLSPLNDCCSLLLSLAVEAEYQTVMDRVRMDSSRATAKNIWFGLSGWKIQFCFTTDQIHWSFKLRVKAVIWTIHSMSDAQWNTYVRVFSLLCLFCPFPVLTAFSLAQYVPVSKTRAASQWQRCQGKELSGVLIDLWWPFFHGREYTVWLKETETGYY